MTSKYKIAVIRYSDFEIAILRLSELGLKILPAVDFDGNYVQIENRIERCCSPEIIDYRGHHVISILLTEEQLNRLPDLQSDNPVFLVDWMSNLVEDVEIVSVNPETGEEVIVVVEQPLPWPKYSIQTENGLVIQSAGRFMI